MRELILIRDGGQGTVESAAGLWVQVSRPLPGTAAQPVLKEERDAESALLARRDARALQMRLLRFLVATGTPSSGCAFRIFPNLD